jgi:hypothetical protein
MNAKNVENPSTISHPFLYIKEVHTEGEALWMKYMLKTIYWKTNLYKHERTHTAEKS